MADLKPVRVPNFQGGLSTRDRTILEPNQLSVAENVFYNFDHNLQTRRGIANFGNTIPAAITRIHLMDTTAGNGTWGATDDAANVAIDNSNQKRGAAAIEFDVDVSASGNDYATLTNSTMVAVDISGTKGSIRFWMKVPTGFTTDLTNMTVRVGEDSSNYYEWTVTSFTENAFQFHNLDFDDATTTGAPDDTMTTYVRFQITYDGAYVDQANILIDDIVAYSATTTTAMDDIKYFKSGEEAPIRYLITFVAGNMFEYDETSEDWSLIKSGLTAGLKYGFTAYKNIMYFSNGTDNYFSYDGQATTEHTGANTYKAKYLLMASDVGYALGDPSVPSSLAYTGGTPANLNTYPNVLVLDEDDSSGIGTGLTNLGPVVIASKNKKIYKVNVATPSREHLDYSNGVASGSAFIRVENEVFLLNESGIYTLSQREGTTGSLRADPLSDDIQTLIDGISDKTVVFAIYVEKLKNVYFFTDTDSNGVADSALVFSILTKRWTKYTNMAVNAAVIWEDSAGDEYFLVANALTGQCRQIEVGTNDNSSEIAAVVETKDFDFSQPETQKTVETIDIFGFIGDTSKMHVRVFIDDEDKSGSIEVDGANFVSESETGFSLAQNPLAQDSLGGGGGGSGETIDFYPFKVRVPMYQTGGRIRVKFQNETVDSQWILTKIDIYPFAQPLDFYPNDCIL